MNKKKNGYDCQKCGACCAQPAQSWSGGFADMFADEVDLLPKGSRRRLVVVTSSGSATTLYSTPSVPDPNAGYRCGFLEGVVKREVGCSVYKARPNVCRDFEPGSDACKASRKEYGLPEEPS